MERSRLFKPLALVLTCVLLVSIFGVTSAPRALAQSGSLIIASIGNGAVVGNGAVEPVSSTSSDGSVVAFISSANNLVANDDNPSMDIFVRDRTTSQTERIVNPIAFGPDVRDPVVSGNGRYIAFVQAYNTSIPRPLYVYRYDRVTQESIVVSLDTAGDSHIGRQPSISEDGRFVVFQSTDSLTTNDGLTRERIYLRDTELHTTTLVSSGLNNEAINAGAFSPRISPNGQFIVFDSTASNIVYNDTNSTSDVYLYDRLSGQTRRVIEKAGQPAVSNSGQVVAGGVESPDGSCNIFNTCILLYDLQSNLLRKIALAARAGVELPSDISADGRFVTFETESPDVVPDDTNGKIDVFRFDTLNNTVESITAPSGIVVACCGGVRRTAISADGQHITFVSQDMPTVDIDTNGFLDVLIWDSVSNGFSISGKVLDNQNKPVVEAEISDGKGNKTITDIYGKFVFSNLKQGSYIFTPSKTGYVFYPSYQQVELSSNLENLDFIGALKSDTSIDYFALGDSVSAGHGLTDNAVDDPYYNCRRSDLSYPYIVKHELDKRYKSVTMYHFACSGAFAIKPKSLKTSDDLKDPLQWFGTQVALANNVLSAKSRPKDRKAIVTLTMGMNDYPWTNGFQMFYLLRGRTKEQFIADVNKIVDSSTDETEKQLRILLKNKNVTVIVVQYHSAFNMRSHIFKLTFGANDGCGLISSLECYDLVSYAVERLNQKLNEKLVGNLSRQFPNRVVFADGIYDQFKGGYDSYLEVPVDSHAAPQNTCGDALPTSADTWIQYPDDPNSFSFPKREATPFERIYPWPALEALSKVDNWRGDCFHPNRKGMEVIAAQVYRKLLVVTP